MVELYPQNATLVIDLDRFVEAAMFDANIIEHPKGRSRKISELWVVSLHLKFADNDDRNNHFMLGKAGYRRRIRQENTCI